MDDWFADDNNIIGAIEEDDLETDAYVICEEDDHNNDEGQGKLITWFILFFF